MKKIPNIPSNDKFKEALLTSLSKKKRIYPGAYERQYNINIKDFMRIMNELSEKRVVSLKFQIRIDGELKNELYKLQNIPSSIYDDEKAEDIKIEPDNHLIPVYEVLK